MNQWAQKINGEVWALAMKDKKEQNNSKEIYRCFKCRNSIVKAEMDK